MSDPNGKSGKFSQASIVEIANQLAYYIDKMRTLVATMEAYGISGIETTNANAPTSARNSLRRWLKVADAAIEEHVVQQTEIVRIDRK